MLWNINQDMISFFQETAFESAVCKMSAVLFRIETVSPEGTVCGTVQVPSSAGDMELN